MANHNDPPKIPPRDIRRSSSIPNFSRLQLDDAAPSNSDTGAYRRPSTSPKQLYSQFHVTSHGLDDGERPSSAFAPPPPLFPIPEREPSCSSTRNTWPVTQQDRRQYRYAFDTPPTLVRTPWEAERARGLQRRLSQRRPDTRTSISQLPARVFEQLPREIYECILDRLRDMHSAPSLSLDVAGLQQDLRSLCLVNRRWHRFARENLWRELWLPSSEEPPRRGFSLKAPKSPLQRLARTVRNSPALALLVRHLHVTATLASEIDTALMTDRERKSLWGVVASITAVCPNVESLGGYVPLMADRTSTLLARALAACPKLKEHAWDLRACNLGEKSIPGFSPRTLVESHDQWKGLETLVLCSSPSQELGAGVIPAILQRLPSLKHLMLQHLSRQDFHNSTLMALPPLQSLRLEHLEGITDQGVEQLAYTRVASSLQRLSLIALELTSLRTLHTLLDHLCRLSYLAFIQQTSPEPTPGILKSTALNLGSPTLRSLHWAPQLSTTGTATEALARRIALGYFPRLRTIKAPADHDGLLQALCRPIPSQRLTATDRALLLWAENENIIPTASGTISSTTSRSPSSSSTGSSGPDDDDRALRLAQLQAQMRIRSRRAQPSMSVVVEEFDGEAFDFPLPLRRDSPHADHDDEARDNEQREAEEEQRKREEKNLVQQTQERPLQEQSEEQEHKVQDLTEPTILETTASGQGYVSTASPQIGRSRASSITQHTHIIGSFLGNLTSQIEYRLDEDVPGSGRALGCLDDVTAPPGWAIVGAGKRERDVGLGVLF